MSLLLIRDHYVSKKYSAEFDKKKKTYFIEKTKVDLNCVLFPMVKGIEIIG